MLFTPGSHFNWQVDNFGATYTDTGLGVNVPSNASANVKGTDTSIMVGIAEDCYGIQILFSGGASDTNIRRGLVDLLIDPAAGIGNTGSSWSVAIANLLQNSSSFIAGNCGYSYYFPLYLKAGTAFGAAHMAHSAGPLNVRIAIRVFGKPSRPDVLNCGTKVQTIGAVVASTSGTGVTPGTNAMGSYSSTLGTLSSDAWWWQLGWGSNDATMNSLSYLYDVAVNATNKVLCLQGLPAGAVGTSERAFKHSLGMGLPIQAVASGQDVYVRAASIGTAITTITAIVYALGD